MAKWWFAPLAILLMLSIPPQCLLSSLNVSLLCCPLSPCYTDPAVTSPCSFPFSSAFPVWQCQSLLSSCQPSQTPPCMNSPSTGIYQNQTFSCLPSPVRSHLGNYQLCKPRSYLENSFSNWLALMIVLSMHFIFIGFTLHLWDDKKSQSRNGWPGSNAGVAAASCSPGLYCVQATQKWFLMGQNFPWPLPPRCLVVKIIKSDFSSSRWCLVFPSWMDQEVTAKAVGEESGFPNTESIFWIPLPFSWLYQPQYFHLILAQWCC